MNRAIVIGIGNPYRGDDGAGLAVAARIHQACPPGVAAVQMGGELVSLLDTWDGVPAVYLADAVCSGGTPGTVYRFDAAAGLPSAPFRNRGTHTFSVADTVELARALGRLPARLVGYGIEGASFAAGTALSAEVVAAVDEVAQRLLAELRAAGGGP
ncbi:MAG TPA: hydrogenase maturation protease [Streptosporangiaceae bacterium]|nr:hydrogenase maturation protease [Streptosporangiaceae bacterium]